MTSEQTVSEAQVPQGRLPLGDPQGHDEQASGGDGQNTSHGMGQSKSSRRRRRKRKNKGENGAGGEASSSDTTAGEAVPVLQSSVAPQASAHQNGAHSNGQNGASSGTGKRWKKKFRDRDRQRSPENPGNISAGAAPAQQHSNGGSNGFRDANSHQPGNGGGFKRKGGSSGGGSRQQQRGPRSFVGPMDHSYRVANGNFADTPPSTIESHGNYQSRGHARPSFQSDSQPIDYSQGRIVPIAADAPTKIYFFIEDLFFIAKIQETARKLGVKVAFIKNDKESIAALTSHEEDDRPGLIVFDLNNANAKPMTLIPKLKTKLKKGTSIIGFLSHLQGDLKAKAVDAGCDTVMPRAAFSQNLPNLLRRYGIVDEDEPNFNQ